MTGELCNTICYRNNQTCKINSSCTSFQITEEFFSDRGKVWLNRLNGALLPLFTCDTTYTHFFKLLKVSNKEAFLYNPLTKLIFNIIHGTKLDIKHRHSTQDRGKLLQVGTNEHKSKWWMVNFVSPLNLNFFQARDFPPEMLIYEIERELGSEGRIFSNSFFHYRGDFFYLPYPRNKIFFCVWEDKKYTLKSP